MTAKAVVDPLISRTRAISTRVAEAVIRRKLQEIEEAVERKMAEKDSAK